MWRLVVVFRGYAALSRVLLVAMLTLFAVASADSAETLLTLKHSLLPEASGMAVSGRAEHLLWFLNDSGNRAELIALDYAQEQYSSVKVDGAKNRDWEDLSAFSYAGQSWLAIADVGDNDGKRDHVFIYLLPEPMANARKARVHTRLAVTFPDGPRDVESVAADSATQSIYLLSKREKSPRLYRVALPDLSAPLPKKKFELERDAERLGKIKSLPRPSKLEEELFGKYSKYRWQPTAMTMLPDGSAIAVLTYGGAFLAKLGAGRDWYAALNDSLCRVSFPQLRQAEAIAADAQGRLYVTSEGKQSPLIRLPAACDP